MHDADLTELIRDGVDELTAGARAPAGLAARALQRHHRRRAAVRAGRIGAVAGAAAAAAAAVTLTAAAPPRAALTAAYVIRHTEHALAASSSRDFIEARAVTTARPASGSPLPGRARSAEFAYRRQFRDDGLARGGRPVYTEWIRYTPGHQRVVMVNYQQRTWWRATHGSRPSARGCKTPFDIGPPQGPESLAGWIRHAFACRQLRLAGHQRIGGTHTLKLTYHLYRTTQTLWVSSSTWLPVRWVTRDSGFGTTTITYRYLRATPARIALLRPVIPAGFRKVSPLSPRA
jgi:hypothetical protein